MAIATLSLVLVGYTSIAIAKRSEFHVTVECYYHTDFSDDYCVSYRQGIIPFYHSGTLMTTFDLSRDTQEDWFEYYIGRIFGELGVEHQVWLSGNKEQAISLAKTITCYDSAAAYNDRVLERFFGLTMYRNSHPVSITIKKETNCCTDQNIY